MPVLYHVLLMCYDVMVIVPPLSARELMHVPSVALVLSQIYALVLVVQRRDLTMP